MVSNSLQTFTNSWQGLRNPKMEKIMNFLERNVPIGCAKWKLIVDVMISGQNT